MELFLVGGAVRDMLMDRPCKDWDFSCVLSSEDTSGHPDLTGLQTLEAVLVARGFEVLAVTADKFTIRARAPKGFEWLGQEAPRVCDFVLARKEHKTGPSRGDIVVSVGTLFDDLARRDFTMNAIAQDSEGFLIDPFRGAEAIGFRMIESVGDAADRFAEDGLRVLRAIRFAIVLGFDIGGSTWDAIGPEFIGADITRDRIREELAKAFFQDTPRTLRMLEEFGLTDRVFRDLWLMPTSAESIKK